VLPLRRRVEGLGAQRQPVGGARKVVPALQTCDPPQGKGLRRGKRQEKRQYFKLLPYFYFFLGGGTTMKAFLFENAFPPNFSPHI